MENVDDTKCLICNDKIERFYLKVSACRACTVFFRRSVQMGRTYKCQLGYKSCNLKTKTKGKPLCKFCRLEKCKELGMKLERVRRKGTNKPKPEPTTSTDDKPLPTPTIGSPATQPPPSVISTTMESVIKSPIQDSPYSNVTSSSKSSEKPKQFLNVQPIEMKIKDILRMAPMILTLAPGIRLTFLQQLCFHFPAFYEEIRCRDAVIMTTMFDRKKHFTFIQKFWLELAKLLMKCEQFAELSFEDKWLLYKHVWLIFFKIERFYSSIQIFGTSFNDYRVLYDDQTAIDYAHPELTISEFESMEKSDQWKKLWAPIRDRYLRTMLNPMKYLNVSQFELIYMLAQILWSAQDIPGLSENAIRIAEEVSDQISNELHNYYTHDKHLTNYAARLTKINKIIASTEACLSAKKDMSVIVKIFNFFDLEVIGSELCD